MKINSSLPGNQTLADTAASKSVIRHPQLPLVILRTDYLAIAKGNYCAAKLLAVFENWTNWFVRQGKPERWVRLTTEVISQHLLGEHKKQAIQKALALLVNLGFIQQYQRRKHKYDWAFFYWLDIERVQEAIDALEPQRDPDTEEDYLRMNASIDPTQNPNQSLKVTNDTLPTANQQLLKVTNDALPTANRCAANSQPICQSAAHRSAANSQSINRHLNKKKIAADNINAAAPKNLSAKEEEATLDPPKETKIPEEEATQGNAISTESISEPQTLASVEDKPEPLDKPKDSDQDECSGARNENENQSHKSDVVEGMDYSTIEDGIDQATDEYNCSSEPMSNPEADEIAIALRDVGLLNPEVKAEAMKHPLGDIQSAIRLYNQRNAAKPINNPQGWITRCLQSRWWVEDKTAATALSPFPTELVEWYEKACAAGIVDGRELQFCPGASTMGNVDQLQVVMIVPLAERRVNLPPFKFLLWRDAIAQFPL